MTTITALTRTYRSIRGPACIAAIDLRIFTHFYFERCLECSTCNDACCSYGVDVDLENVARILAYAEGLEARLGIGRGEFFQDEVQIDPEFGGGGFRRTRTRDGACVFRSGEKRGCGIHAFALERGIPVHELKPMVSMLFPLTFDRGVLQPSSEVVDGSLVCGGEGASVYQGAREALTLFFEPELVLELDAREAAMGQREPNRLRVIRS